jgi:hypothetical protein
LNDVELFPGTVGLYVRKIWHLVPGPNAPIVQLLELDENPAALNVSTLVIATREVVPFPIVIVGFDPKPPTDPAAISGFGEATSAGLPAPLIGIRNWPLCPPIL